VVVVYSIAIGSSMAEHYNGKIISQQALTAIWATGMGLAPTITNYIIQPL
jgi:hypothetical protein